MRVRCASPHKQQKSAASLSRGTAFKHPAGFCVEEGLHLFLWSWRARGRDQDNTRRHLAHQSSPTMQPGWLYSLLRREVCKRKWHSPPVTWASEGFSPSEEQECPLDLENLAHAPRSSSLSAPHPSLELEARRPLEAVVETWGA